MNITYWQELRVIPLSRLNVSPCARACDYLVLLTESFMMSLLWQVLYLSWCELEFSFLSECQFPTATLPAYSLLSWVPSNFVSAYLLGLYLIWADGTSSYCPYAPIITYSCFFFFGFLQSSSRYTVVSFPWPGINGLFLPSAIDLTKCLCCSSNFVT